MFSSARDRTFNVVVMPEMLVIILAGIRAGAEIVVPFALKVCSALMPGKDCIMKQPPTCGG